MNAVWVNNERYWHCWLCKLYYAGLDKEIYVVDDPFRKVNKPQEIIEDKDDLNETQN